jgi:class 3 adenylate cyclase
MSPEVPEPPSGESRTFICTVVFIDLVDYSRRPVGEQGTLKRHLNQLVARCLAHVAETDRLILDTGDGAALCFFGDPEDALFTATRLRDGIIADPGPAGARLRIGINLGPGRVVRDLNGNRNVIGDGINAAQRVMSFAAPNQILVSRSYYEVVSHISEDYARLFQYAGLHRDKHIREHELYEIQVATASAPGAGPEAAPAETLEVGASPAPLPPELVTAVGVALTNHLGPVATLIVRRAAAGARDARELLDRAAAHLSGPAREQFLAETSRLGPASERPPAAGRPRASGAAPGLSPEALSAAERRLARYLGPIAKVLVAQAARDAADLPALAERLARHITDPRARKQFLGEMRP